MEGSGTGGGSVSPTLAAPAEPPAMLGPGELIKPSGKFPKPTKIPGKNYSKDEVVIRNADSGKGMCIPSHAGVPKCNAVQANFRATHCYDLTTAMLGKFFYRKCRNARIKSNNDSRTTH